MAEPEARRPEDVEAEDWLRFEQEKHERLLAAATARRARAVRTAAATEATRHRANEPGETV